MHFQLLPPLLPTLTLLLISPPIVSSWYLLTLRQDRKWNDDNQPFSNSWLQDITSLTACIPNKTNKNKPVPIDAVALYNRPGTSTARAVGLYDNSNCGIRNPGTKRSIKIGTHVPDILLVPDQSRLEGVHLFDIRDLGVESAARFYRAINPDEEVGEVDGLLWEAELRAGVYWWDGKGSWRRIRQFGEEGRVRYVAGGVADYLFSPYALYNYVRLLLEYFINPERMGDEEVAFEGYKRVAEKVSGAGRAEGGHDVDIPALGGQDIQSEVDNPNIVSAYFEPIPTSVPSSNPQDHPDAEARPQDWAVQQNLPPLQWIPPLQHPELQPPAQRSVLSRLTTYFPWDTERFSNGLGSSLNLQVLRGIQEIMGMAGQPWGSMPFVGLEGGEGGSGVTGVSGNTGSGRREGGRVNEGVLMRGGDNEVIVIDDDEEEEEDLGDRIKKHRKVG
ncbi:hypothetical protein TWF718_000495 [Orbilia javanica]|uniref:Uncharacterized protein n=1 Tax=Orbilia javanica TaxID=47235 RepID=A0AAN8N844_9PEZI